jgi:hypothetical protein
MTKNPFQKATKEQSFLRLALVGISGSGKTYSALNIAQHLVSGAKIAVVDTEHGSASKYADLFEFDTVNLSKFEPKNYADMIRAAAANGYDVVILDSLSHAWDALLAMKDRFSKANGENSFTAWRKVNPHYAALIEAILDAPIHVIGTIRAKSDYVMEEYQDSNNNTRTKPVKVGMKAIQRDGFEYEFDVVANMNLENDFVVEKTRCPALSGAVYNKPGADVAQVLAAWLSDGEPVPTVKNCQECGELYAVGTLDDRGWCVECCTYEGEMRNKTGNDRGAALSGDMSDAVDFDMPDPRDDRTEDDEFPLTIRGLWPQIDSRTLSKEIAALVEQGFNVGAVIADVKATCELDSLKDFDGTLEELMLLVIERREF